MDRSFTVAATAAVVLASSNVDAHSQIIERSATTFGEATQCELPRSEMTERAWDETVKTLRAVQETTRSGRLSIRARLYQQVSKTDDHVIRETDSILEGLDETPFVRYSPDVVVRRSGYAIDLADGTRVYELPTPSAFIDDNFQTTHCFWLADGPSQGTVRLHFQPTDNTLVDGLAGAFTLTENTTTLQGAEFRFANEPIAGDDAKRIGSLRIAQINEGDWFVESWQLRRPIVQTSPDSSSHTVLGFDDIGAHVLQASDTAGNRVWSEDEISVLYGTVFDSLNNGPLQGGVVAISGTRHVAQTDEYGGFALAGYWTGSYGIVFGHQRLDSLGFVSPPQTVQLRRGSETAVSLSVPPLTTVIERRCPALVGMAGRRMLVGVVRDDVTQQPVRNALVSISRDLIPEELQGFSNERSNDVAMTDSLGMYTVCDIPIGVTLSVAATKGNRQSSFSRATFWEDAVTYNDGEPQPSSYPVGRLDMTVKAMSDYSRVLTGTVTDALTGFVMPAVTVTVEGMSHSTTTDSAGVFRLNNLPSGPVRLNLRRVGYRMLRYTTTGEEGNQMVLGAGILPMVQADPDAVTLDPITVLAEGVAPKLSEFEERRSRGFGAFLTKKDFEEWNPTVATDVLRRMRGVRVRPNPYYGVNGDTRKHVIEPSRDIGQRVTRVISANESRRTESGGGDITINECPMLLFFDGVYLGDSYESDVDNIISTTDLSAVEVYSPSQVPVQFALPGATCGVVVFWST